jgi:ATP-dependent Lon protease
VGGDILLIEASCSLGKGELILTGNLGDIMKESVQVALAYVKANHTKFAIDPAIFSKNDINIHVLEGATPKEGPSAGIALTSAIISALTGQTIPGDIGMTGEITLHGQVEAIGGLKEKAIAAHRSELKKIIIPQANKKDIDDIPTEVRRDLKIILVEKYEEVAKKIFVAEKKLPKRTKPNTKFPEKVDYQPSNQLE